MITFEILTLYVLSSIWITTTVPSCSFISGCNAVIQLAAHYKEGYLVVLDIVYVQHFLHLHISPTPQINYLTTKSYKNAFFGIPPPPHGFLGVSREF